MCNSCLLFLSLFGNYNVIIVCLIWDNLNTLSYNRIENSWIEMLCMYLNNLDVVLPTKCFYKFVCQWCNVLCFCFFWQQTEINIVRFTVHKKEKMKNIMKIILMEQSKIEKIVINLNANQLTMISLLRFGLVVCGV